MLQQSSRVDADKLLNFDCEVFPFIFEMGGDAFCTMLSKCVFFFPYSYIEHQNITSKAKPQLFTGADIFLPMTCCPSYPQHLDCVTWILIVYLLSWPHENRPRSRSSQMGFLLQSMLMTQHSLNVFALYIIWSHC